MDCSNKTIEESAAEVRDAVTAEYSPGFIVPFAFGVVLHYSGTLPNTSDITYLVDDRARPKATWQWIIVVNTSAKRVYGVHMWMRGYLTPVYEELFKHFENMDYVSKSVTKEPSRFWTRLWETMAAMSKARLALLAIGAIVFFVCLIIRFS